MSNVETRPLILGESVMHSHTLKPFIKASESPASGRTGLAKKGSSPDRKPSQDYGLPVLFAGNRNEASCACSWRAPNCHKNGVDQVANASRRHRPAKAGAFAYPKAITRR